MFDEVESLSFSAHEQKILQLWQSRNIFQKSIEQRKSAPLFATYDGPPFATGLPHYGHLLTGTIKDAVLRYKTMKGFHVPRRFGWDCHGLPIEQEIEKSHKLSGAQAIEHFGIANFNEACRQIVLRYTEEWQQTVHRTGRWVDFAQTYCTMDLEFMESVWSVFKMLYDKGLIYQGFKVMPFSAKLGTPLSNFEAGENYKDVDDPAITVKFRLQGSSDTYFLAWTTTPWTLVSNLALGVGANITYVKVFDLQDSSHYILAQERVTNYYKEEQKYRIEATYTGAELAGLPYDPVLPYFSSHANKGAFHVIAADFVTITDGTGIVHLAPAFGESDFFACQQAGIELVCPIDQNGCFNEQVPEYRGKFVKDVDSEIIRRLKTHGLLFHQATINHRYPFCYRSDTPLIYRAVSTWFVAVEKVKEKMLAANSQIQWVPEHIQQGRFGKWLEGARDWAISRNRYWGTPIPIWQAEDGTIEIIGSIKELEELTHSKVCDLHRHFIDQLTFTYEGKTFKRIKEVFDCWFESGSMPYAQIHYPFENRAQFESSFPADFIAEGLDQTRGWFYTLTVLAAALFDKQAFKSVIVNGLILAEDGNKMSKRLKNYPDPKQILDRYGADALRIYLLNSPAVKAEDLRFSEKGVELVMRQVLIPFWNAYSGFFITYARIYNWKPTAEKFIPREAIDCWIVSLVQKLIVDVANAMDQYQLNRALEPFVAFIDQLTNWYIRRCRRRFWQEQDTQDRRDAFATLYFVLSELVKIMAPFIPFISETIYQNLRAGSDAESVHLCDYPTQNLALRDQDLEIAMELVQKVVSLGHGLRKEHKIKVRQPLSKLTIICPNKETLQFLQKQQLLIAEELNVKEVCLSEEEQDFVSLLATPNFRLLGKKVGKLMKVVQEKIAAFSYKQIMQLQQGNEIILDLGGESVVLTSEDVIVERLIRDDAIAANEGKITILLNTMLDDDLIIEGLAREFVNRINGMRREKEFAVIDRISVCIDTNSILLEKCVGQHKDYIQSEVLARDLIFAPCDGQLLDLNGESATVSITKIYS